MDYIKSKWREIVTILLGLTIVIGRVIVPTTTEVTTDVVLLELSIEVFALLGTLLINIEKIKKIEKEFREDNVKNIFKKAILVPALVIPTLMIMNVIGFLIDKPTVLGTVQNDFTAAFPLGFFISVVIVAPIVEELVFRVSFKDLIPNKVLFIIISSVFFAFIHDWTYLTFGIVAYTAAGVVLSLLYLKNGKIHYNIVGHIFNNLIAFIPMLINLLK